MAKRFQGFLICRHSTTANRHGKPAQRQQNKQDHLRQWPKVTGQRQTNEKNRAIARPATLMK